MPVHGNPHKTLARIFATADTLGATIPKAVLEEHAALADLAARATGLDLRTDVPGVVLASLEAGRDPFTDPAVIAESIRAQLSDNPNNRNSMTTALADRSAVFLDTHAATVWAAFAEPFDTAATALAAALERLGPVDLDDTRAVLARGGNAADVWAGAQQAERTIRDVRAVWKLLGAAGSTFPAEQDRHRLLVIADISAERWTADKLNGSSMGAWDALRAGYRLDLATPETFRARLAAIAELHAKRNAAAEHAREQAAFGKRVRAAS